MTVLDDRLKDELDNDPENMYAGMDADQITARINAVDFEWNRPIPFTELISYLIEKGKWSGILVAGNDKTHTAYSDCLMFISIANNTNITELDLSNPAIVTMLVSIKDATLLVQQNQTDIVAMGRQITSRAEFLRLGRVKAGQVERAL